MWLAYFMTSFSILPMWFLLEVSWEEESKTSRSSSVLFILLIAYNVLLYLSLIVFYTNIK